MWVVLARGRRGFSLCQVIPKAKFGYMKEGFDVTLVAAACVLSLLFTGQVQGVREGTVAAAVFVGLLAKQLGKLSDKMNV